MRDLLLIVLSAGFVAIGLLATAIGNLRVGIPTMVIFGSALFVFVSARARRARTERALAAEGQVQATGGVRMTELRARKFGTAAMCIAIGVAFAREFAPRGWWPASLGWLIAGAGGVLAVITAVRAPSWVQLNPTGIEFGSATVRYVVPWDDLAGVTVGEFNRVPMVFLRLRDVAGLAASVAPPTARAKLIARMASSEGMLGFPLVIQPAAFGVEGAWLARALAQYAAEPGRRGELVERAGIGG